MSSPDQRSLLDAWRQEALTRAPIIFYAVLAALTVSATSAQWGSVRVNLALCALAAAWMLLPLHPGLRKRTPVMAVFVTGIIAITAVLVIRDPWFGFFTFVGYGYSFRLLPWPWPLPALAAVAVLAATAQANSLNKDTLPGLAAYAWSVHALRPEPLETARLSEALADVAGRWSALNRIPVQLTTTGTERPVQPRPDKRYCPHQWLPA